MSKLLVQMTVEDLQAIVREEVKAALRDHTPQVKPRSPYLDSEEAADYLRMPVGVLRKRTQKGEIPSFKIGSVLRYQISELDAWCQAQKKAG